MYAIKQSNSFILCIFIHSFTPKILMEGQKHILGIQVQTVAQSQIQCWYFTFISKSECTLQNKVYLTWISWFACGRKSVRYQNRPRHETKTNSIPVRSSRFRTRVSPHFKPLLTSGLSAPPPALSSHLKVRLTCANTPWRKLLPDQRHLLQLGTQARSKETPPPQAASYLPFW